MNRPADLQAIFFYKIFSLLIIWKSIALNLFQNILPFFPTIHYHPAYNYIEPTANQIQTFERSIRSDVLWNWVRPIEKPKCRCNLNPSNENQAFASVINPSRKSLRPNLKKPQWLNISSFFIPVFIQPVKTEILVIELPNPKLMKSHFDIWMKN